MNKALLESVYALPRLDVSVVAKNFVDLVYQVVKAMSGVPKPQWGRGEDGRKGLMHFLH